MAYFDKISINGTSYDVQDSTAKIDIEELGNQLNETNQDVSQLNDRVNSVEQEVSRLQKVTYPLYKSGYTDNGIYLCAILPRTSFNVDVINNNGTYTSIDALNNVFDYAKTASTAKKLFINCDYFPSRGMIKGNIYGDEDRHNVENYLAINTNTGSMNTYPKGTSFTTIQQAGYDTIIGESFLLVNNGAATTGLDTTVEPRMALGWNSDNYIVVMAPGRTEALGGATYAELQGVFLANHATTAINLDGGASTQMFCRSERGEVYICGAYDNLTAPAGRNVPLNINFQEV